MPVASAEDMSQPATIKTVCCYCGVGCGIEVTRDSRGKLALRGDPDHPANQGRLCSKGRALLHVVASRTDRLTHPQVRLDRSHAPRRASWDHALAHVAREFKRIQATYGNDAVAFYGSGQLLTEEYYVVNKLVKGFLQTNNFDTNSRLCMSSAVMGYKQTLGADGPPVAYADIESCDTFLVTGANPAWCHPIIWRRVEERKAADPNVRIIVIDPRATASASAADLHLQPIPGTDVALHYGLARRLWEIGAVDHAYLQAHVDGWEAFQAAFMPFTLEYTAEVCGISAGDISLAAEWLAGERRFLSMWTMGLNQSSVGVDKNTTLIALSLITGKIGRPGCGPFSLTGQPNAMGGREVGGMATLASGHRDLGNPQHRQEIARHWGVASVPDRPGLTAIELFNAVHDGRVKAVWILGTNPVESLPDAQLVERALACAELVVVQDCYPTATTALADVVLPAATWLEKSGTMTNSERRVSLLNAAIAPPGDALPDSEIICRFAAHFGAGPSFAYDNPAAIYADHVALTAGRDCDVSGLSHARLAEDGPLQWPLPSASDAGAERLYGDGRFNTANQRAQLKAPPFVSRSEHTSPAHPLVLTTGRVRDQWHTMTKTGRVAKLGAHIESPYCEIHPDDADMRGISTGDIVVVSGERGEVQVRAEVTTSIRAGVVFLPMHWGKLAAGERGRTNNLTSPRFDPLSKEPDLKYAAVQVVRFAPAARRVVIVGGGAAAHGFIEAHRAAGLGDSITVFGDEPQPLYNRVLLPHYISGASPWNDLVKATAEELGQRNVHFHPGVRITAINRAECLITDADGDHHPYDLLILATGSRAARHYQGPMPKHGVHFLRQRTDAEAIRSLAGAGRRLVVVGGGILGLELADALHQLGSTVTVLQRSDQLMGRQLDRTSAGMLAGMLADRGIAVRFRAEIDELEGRGHVTGVRLKDGKVLPCDAVVFATGTAPNAELARAALLDCSTGVVVDRHFRTSDPAIFAIGEVAEWHGGGDGRCAGTTAAAEEQARQLVEFMRGNLLEPYRGPFNANVLKVHGIACASAGATDDDLPGCESVVYHDSSTGVYQRAVVKDDRLVGIVMLGDTAGFADYARLIRDGTELDERRSGLLRGGGVVAPLEGRLVCSCNGIGEDTITRTIRQQGVAGGCSLAGVCSATRAGTACGSCRPEVAKLITRCQPPSAVLPALAG
jgi:ferredoxin-nitrate reductase